MKVGEQLKLTIPPSLGYGDRGQPPTIPGGATLIFELELVSVRVAPAFVMLDDEKAKEHASGFRYQILAEGEGEAPTAEETCVFHVVLWNHERKPIESSYVQEEPIKAPLSALRLAAIRDATMLIKPGGAIQCEIAAKSLGRMPPGTPEDAKVYLHVALFNVIKPLPPLPVPVFVMPTDEQLEVKESGLRVQVVEPGREDGKSPKMGEFVTVHYAGWLADGKPFDSSFKRGETSSFQLGAVIPGWNEGLQLMKEGATYRFVIPAKLAYGARATGEIPPNSTLVFLVKLVKVGKED